MLRRFIATSLFLLGFALPALAGMTTVTGTVVDPNGNAYANGTVGAALNCNTGALPTTTGAPVVQNYGPGALSIGGAFSIVLTDVNTITPPGCTYQLTVCAQTTNLHSRSISARERPEFPCAL